MNDAPPASDQAIVARIAMLLRAGILLSALMILAGGVAYLARHGAEPTPDRTRFEPGPEEFTHPGSIWRAAIAGHGRAIVQLGILVLIATPVMRVAYSALAFARRRDLTYTLIAMFVLGVLMIGFAVAPLRR